MTTIFPAGFHAYVANIGVKDSTDDFSLIVADAPCAAAAMFTQSRFAGPSVVLSQQHIANNQARGVVVISKNANVATGDEGMRNTVEIAETVARAIGCETEDILIASTGVIGRQYPMDNVRAGLATIPVMRTTNVVDDVARAIMTTDTVPKIASARVKDSDATVIGMAKGVGMIEPNMATLIALIFTDADVSAPDLDRIFRSVIDRTFNCVSIDTDTSTSDTALVLASGVHSVIDLGAFEQAINEVALSLTKQVARDGEGAEKLIEVYVDAARDNEQAKTVAKAIVNSPLVKTAVHGADPNWGRVAMAVGKCSQYPDIDQNNVVIRFGNQEVYPTHVDEPGLATLSNYMRGTEVRIHVSLNTGKASSAVWGCDLTADYVRINADYTT